MHGLIKMIHLWWFLNDIGPCARTGSLQQGWDDSISPPMSKWVQEPGLSCNMLRLFPIDSSLSKHHKQSAGDRGYLNACNVECCDESVQCTLEKVGWSGEPRFIATLNYPLVKTLGIRAAFLVEIYLGSFLVFGGDNFGSWYLKGHKQLGSVLCRCFFLRWW